MTREEDEFLGEFFRAVVDDEPLLPNDSRYVPLYEGDGLQEDDPVALLATAIRYAKQSVQLLAGFRGIGKSTELRRLRQTLETIGYKIILIDIEDYVNASTPVDVSDFLMAVAGAFGEAVVDEALLGENVLKESYWERAVAFMQTRVELKELSGEFGGRVGAGTDVEAAKVNAELAAKVGFKANLKEDPTFKSRLQEKMAGHLGALTADVRKFFEDCRKEFVTKYGPDVKIVVLVDSVEHIRGTSVNAGDVQASIETLFATHHDKLKIPGYHVVYTIPPFLKVRYPNLGSLYGVGAVQMFPAVKVKDKRDGVVTMGLERLRTVIEKRQPAGRRLLTPEEVTRIIVESGGHLRDLLRIVAEVIRRTRTLPASSAVVTSALDQLRTESLPIAEDDAVWLAKVARTGGAALESREELVHLARFFDTNMVLCYRNGPEWYDVHPLIKKHVMDLAKQVEERDKARSSQG
ncbi:hypothetical protein [Polyangium sorediatum]|uniref:hypothetical protein n=1 Tax=Polyangium sorediatum TaxID=889274 RepID=UPI00254773D1|nr:hypothetical protein [Polyangium sorediatum]